MDKNHSLTQGERIEKEFKDFIGRLLDAHSYDFMKEKVLFSHTTLRRTLTKFCEIIADELACSSCTIQLQMYDSKMMEKPFLNQLIQDYLLKIAKNHKNTATSDTSLEKYIENELAGDKNSKTKSLPDGLREFIKHRIELLKTALTFPYWASDYKKGSASLVAANSSSPWADILKDKADKFNYISLNSGISKNIYQENVARVRDRLSIRETRGFRKRGQADMIVWNNTDWEHVFKDYYGVPIRIHSGGEVIGILKAEN